MEKRRDVGHELHAISNLLGRKIEAGKRERGMGDITPVQIWIIRYLYEHQGKDVFQKDIEKDFSITRSTVTGILKLMEKNDYIERVTVPKDARLKKLVLTEKGKKLLHMVCEHVSETNNMLINGMTDEEVDTLFRLLDKVKQNLL